jgi:SecD/SecF fusion protein
MQGKGLIKLVLGLLLAVCLFQLAYYIPTRKVERDAVDYAESFSANLQGEAKDVAFKNARATYLDSMSSEEIFKIPYLVNYTYSDLKKQQLALGLDLKGGMSTTLEVDLSELVVTLAGRNSKDQDLVNAVAAAKRAQEGAQDNFISLFVGEFKKIAPTRRLASVYQQSQMLEGIDLETSDSEVERKLREKADQTVDLTFKRLKERIDKLGVVQPNVTLDPQRDLILVEMPGIDNPQRARQFLEASADLGFWETFRFSDSGIMASLKAADAKLKAATLAEGQIPDSLMDAQKGPLFSLLDENIGQYMPTSVGAADKNKRVAISEMLSRPEIAQLLPKNVKFLWGYKPFEDPTTAEPTGKYLLYTVKLQPNSDKAPIEGDVVTRAGQALDEITGEPEVNLTMNATGAKKWAELTGRAFTGNAEGNRREVAIVLDDEVVTTPSVNDGAITGGSTRISGSFDIQEAQDLANILEVGKLPAKTKVVQESTVGPSLGKENIQKSVRSLVIAMLLVMGFMIFYYMRGGVVAVITLLLNIILIFGVLSSLGTVLTLPGIAGIVLTVGMAVDANVIIFERVREELVAGKSLLESIAEGFKHSYSAILDANITTLLTAFVLAYFGLGPIKGFAVVLIVGVISSIFTAVVIGKLIIDGYVDGGKRSLDFSNAYTKDILEHINVDWMGNRKMAYLFSGFLVLLSLGSILTRGFDKGVDFTGGHSYNVKFGSAANVTLQSVQDELTKTFGSTPVVKEVDAANTFNITTSFNINKNSVEADQEVTQKLHEAVKGMTKSSVDFETFRNNINNQDVPHVTSYTKVGPTVADDIRTSAFYAGFFALALIFLYIFIRFSKWQYSAGAIIALAHDVIITLGMFSLLKGVLGFSLEIDQAFIAAILTVIGYSINDTVIIYDRIREFFGLGKGSTSGDVINNAINTTLSRTTITSFTTLFVVIMLLVFGGGSIKGFAFAITFGILIGTYSSIFIAAPIVHDLARDKSQGKVTEPQKVSV